MHRLRNSKKRTILLIDDNEPMLRLLSRILSKKYKVTSFTNPLDAISWLTQTGTTPDIILSDINMEEMDGIEFAHYLKMSGLYDHIPIMFISGQDKLDLMPRLITINYADFVAKPFDPETLQLKIEETVNLAVA